ncbi:MAG: hypothetical protein HKN43_08995 [Rhodothermales bacterium]|nr:hypothetical protein [Rhodothermales bacterium]
MHYPFRIGIVVTAFVGVLVSLTGCDSIWGSKSDDTTQEIFEAGRTPPSLLDEVNYVPLFPFFDRSGDGAFLESPHDVYVGYDSFIYVVDDRGLHILDRSGRPANFVAIPGGGSSVIQDRKLNVYVTARRDTLVNNRTWNLPVVLKYADITTGNPQITSIIWHPFDDDTRKFQLPDPLDTDEQVSFTGVAILYNNNIFVSRTGPLNEPGSLVFPHNAILEFNEEGINTQAVPLNPARESLRSAIGPSSVMTFVQPPQRESFNPVKHFAIAQTPPDGSPLRFSVLSILAVETPDGIVYRPDSDKLSITTDTTRGSGFLYEEFKFDNPADITFAGDNTQYWFVIDSAKDSLFVFTANGVEGVAPPAGSTSRTPVVVSFGGSGDGSTQFSSPGGVAYSNRIVYVADTGNNRISRFRLNTDFE